MAYNGIPITMVFLCENFQLALMDSPRIATEYYSLGSLKWYIQGDSKILRHTLRVHRVNNKEHFLLNNLCLLTRRFEVTIDFC